MIRQDKVRQYSLDVRGSHNKGDKPDLDIEGGLAQLRGLDGPPGRARARLAGAEPLDGHEALLGGQEPGVERRVGQEEAPEQAEEGRQRAREHVDVLPGAQGAGADLREAVVQRAARDGEPPRPREPERLAQGLLRLGVVAAHDGHEGRRHDGFGEACERGKGGGRGLFKSSIPYSGFRMDR